MIIGIADPPFRRMRAGAFQPPQIVGAETMDHRIGLCPAERHAGPLAAKKAQMSGNGRIAGRIDLIVPGRLGQRRDLASVVEFQPQMMDRCAERPDSGAAAIPGDGQRLSRQTVRFWGGWHKRQLLEPKWFQRVDLLEAGRVNRARR